MCSQSVACAPPLRQPAPPHCCKVLWVWGLKCRHRALKLYSQVKWRGPWDPGHHIFLLLPLHDIRQYLPNSATVFKILQNPSDRFQISGNTSIELDRLNCADSAFIVCRTDDELKKWWGTDDELWITKRSPERPNICIWYIFNNKDNTALFLFWKTVLFCNTLIFTRSSSYSSTL